MKITVLALAFVMSFTAFAESTASLSVTASGSVYNVIYKTTGTGRVKVSILDNFDRLVFSETLTNIASFTRPYNFSNLPQGEYTVVVEDKNGKQMEKVNYTLNQVTSFIKVTEVANAENKFMLNVSNNGTETVSVKIFNSRNDLLHTQMVEVTGSFGVIYNLSQVKTSATDKVTFLVTTGSGKTEVMEF